MRNFTTIVFSAVAALLLTGVQTLAQIPASVFLTAGQSNADGREYVNKLPYYLRNGYRHLKFANVTMSSKGSFGERTFTDPKGRFAFCDVTNYFIEQAEQRDFYAIKCAYGGTAIDTAATYAHLPVWCADSTWIAGNNAYRGDINTGKSLTKSLTEGFDDCVDVTLGKLSEGYDVKAIMWHQGESDRSKGGHYYQNFKDMINYMRNAIHEKTGKEKDKTLPFIFGTISRNSKQFSTAVDEAQKRVAKELPNVYYIDMSQAGLRSDALHFDSTWTEYLGKMMYNQLVELKLVNGEKLNVVFPGEPSPTDTIAVDVERSWDFSKAWSDESVAKLTAEGSRWESKGSMGYRYNSAMKELQELATADGYVFPETKGLYYQSSTGNRIYINPGRNLCFYADNLLLTLPKVAPGQTVTIVTASAKGERGLTTDSGDSLELISGGVKSTGKVTNRWKVKESLDGPVDLTFHSNGGAIYVYSIEVTSPPSVQILVGADQKVMFSSPKACEVKSHDELIKAYVAVGYDKANDMVVLEQVDTIPARTGVIVIGEESLVEAKVVDTDKSYPDNLFQAVSADTVLVPATSSAEVIYELKTVDGSVDFHKMVSSTALSANSAYLRLPLDAGAGDIVYTEKKNFSGVDLVEDSRTQSGGWFTVEGKEVKKPGKGVFVRNGQKYLFK